MSINAISPVSGCSSPYTGYTNTIQQRRSHTMRAAAASALTAGAVFVATRAPKSAEVNQLKMTQRLGRAGVAGVTMFGVMALLGLNKEYLVNAANKVKEVFKRNKAEKDLDNMKPIEGTAQNPEDAELAKANPFANSENVKVDDMKAPEASTNPFAQAMAAPQEQETGTTNETKAMTIPQEQATENTNEAQASEINKNAQLATTQMRNSNPFATEPNGLMSQPPVQLQGDIGQHNTGMVKPIA